MTFITSSSILILNAVLGKPEGEATVNVVWLAFMAPESIVSAPGPTRHMYEVAGVSSKVPRLLFRFG